MSDYDLPDLPSDDELGITDEDREFAEELGGDGPEMSDAELAALLGEAPKPTVEEQKATTSKSDDRAAKKAARRAAKEEKRRKKEAQKAEKAAAAAAEKAASSRDPDSAQPEGEAAAVGAGAEETSARTPLPADGPRRRWRGVVTLLVLLTASWIASSRTGLPRPVPANAADTVFSSARAMSTLIEIARDAHPPGSPEHRRVREYIVERLTALGAPPEIQTTTSIRQSPNRMRAATVRNIVARFPGTESTGAVLLTAHYDGHEISRAAGDAGSAVAAILEAVRALRAGAPLRNDLIVLITDAEELGLLGARAFVDEHPWIEDVEIVLSFEARGSAGPSIMFETNELNGWVIDALEEFDPEPFANSMAFELYRRMPNDTDFTPLKEAGKQGLNFAAIDNAHVYHQEWDTPEAMSEATLQHHGVRALAATRHFGDADLTSVNAPNKVYFTLPFAGLVVYPESLVLPISGALVLLLAAALSSARRAGARPRAIGVGLVIAVATGALAFGAAWFLAGWLTRFHPEAGSLQGATYHGEGWYMIAFAAIAFTAVTTVYSLARRWLRPSELAIGAVLLPLLAAVAVSAMAPLAAMNLQWPVAAALASITVAALLGTRAESTLGWIVSMLLAVPVVFFLIPLSELVWLAVKFEAGAVLAVYPVVLLQLCMPMLEGFRHPNSWWSPLAGSAVAVVAVGLGILTAGPSAERPAPSTLVYAYEHGTGSAVWATDPGADSLDAEAIAWAVERAGGSFDATRDLSGFDYLLGQIPTVTAPVVGALPPEVVVTRDSIDGSTRHVDLSVRSSIGAEYMAFTYDGRGDTRLLSINGNDIDDPARLKWAEHWGEPDGAVSLSLEMGADDPIGLHVIEHLLRPEELLGPEAFVRPEGLGPDITRRSDRAMFRYSVGAFVDPRHAIRLPGMGTGVNRSAPARPQDPSAPARTDTVGAATDTTTARPDTATVVPESAAAEPDSSAAQPDTGLARPASTRLPDTTAVVGRGRSGR